MSIRRTVMYAVAMGLLGLVALGVEPGRAEPARAESARIETQSFMIPSGDPGIRLYVSNKHLAGAKRGKPVLWVHGTSVASEASFDLELDGTSWMDYIARRGWDVYFVDVRGFGGSTKPPEMSRPAKENPPLAPKAVAVSDVGKAVDFIAKRRGGAKVALISWSAGTGLVGSYTSEHDSRVSKLVLVAPDWLRESKPGEGSPEAGSQAPLGAYSTWSIDANLKNLQNGAPDGMAEKLFPAAWRAKFRAVEQATDPEGAKMNPPVVRTPSGRTDDSRRYWRVGTPLYDPKAITVPTLIVSGEWDKTVPTPMARAVFAQLVNAPERRLVEVGGASHLIVIETGRTQLFREVQTFLDE
jgi:pimeloyl-ACP methyl ester carboxylesterase